MTSYSISTTENEVTEFTLSVDLPLNRWDIEGIPIFVDELSSERERDTETFDLSGKVRNKILVN